MPKVLIAGCGFLGESAAAFFCAEGWNVLALTRSPESARGLEDRGVSAIAADFSDPHTTLPGEIFDAVLHCASSGRGGADAYVRVYRDGLRNLAASWPAARLIFTSSTSVYAQDDGSVVDEGAATEPARETGRILLEAERIALDAGGVVLRLGGLYGPGRSVLMSRYLSGEARLEDGGERWINQSFRDDAACACVLAASLPGGIYNATDGSPATQREVYSWLAEYFGGGLPPEGAVDSGRKRGVTNKRVSSARLQACGWTPRFSCYREAIPMLAESLGVRQGLGSS